MTISLTDVAWQSSTITHYVMFGRLMSELADINIQSSVGMFHFMMSYIVLAAQLVLGHVRMIT